MQSLTIPRNKKEEGNIHFWRAQTKLKKQPKTLSVHQEHGEFHTETYQLLFLQIKKPQH